MTHFAAIRQSEALERGAVMRNSPKRSHSNANALGEYFVQLTWTLRLELAGRCSMNRAGFRACKASCHIPRAHRAGRNTRPGILLLENDDAGMPSRSLYSSHRTFLGAPKHMMSENQVVFQAIKYVVTARPRVGCRG